jgi:hypothetical protein
MSYGGAFLVIREPVGHQIAKSCGDRITVTIGDPLPPTTNLFRVATSSQELGAEDL